MLDTGQNGHLSPLFWANSGDNETGSTNLFYSLCVIPQDCCGVPSRPNIGEVTLPPSGTTTIQPADNNPKGKLPCWRTLEYILTGKSTFTSSKSHENWILDLVLKFITSDVRQTNHHWSLQSKLWTNHWGRTRLRYEDLRVDAAIRWKNRGHTGQCLHAGRCITAGGCGNRSRKKKKSKVRQMHLLLICRRTKMDSGPVRISPQRGESSRIIFCFFPRGIGQEFFYADHCPSSSGNGIGRGGVRHT